MELDSHPEEPDDSFGDWVWGWVFRLCLPVLIGLPAAAWIWAGDVQAAREVAWWETVFVFGMAPLLIPLWYAAFAIAVGLLDTMGWSEDDRIGPARRSVLTVLAMPIYALFLWLVVVIAPWFAPGDGSSRDDYDACEVSRVIAC